MSGTIDCSKYSTVLFMDSMIALEAKPLASLPWKEIDAAGHSRSNRALPRERREQSVTIGLSARSAGGSPVDRRFSKKSVSNCLKLKA